MLHHRLSLFLFLFSPFSFHPSTVDFPQRSRIFCPCTPKNGSSTYSWRPSPATPPSSRRSRPSPTRTCRIRRSSCTDSAGTSLATTCRRTFTPFGKIEECNVVVDKLTGRTKDDPIKTEHLRVLDGASERLQLLKANLLDEGSFDASVDGCEGVFHTASPVYQDVHVTDPEVELIDPAVKGTLNVLGSCVRTTSVKRVVVTSSISAVLCNERPRPTGVTVDESWFSDPESCKTRKYWYTLSKTMAEESAWKFSKENNLDMVTINPAMVIGPLLQPTLNTSSATILNLINGSSTYGNTTFGWINVKDVAYAHILAFEVSSASGRYCLVESVAHYSKIIKHIHELFPAIQLPEKCANDEPFVPEYNVSKEKTEGLGVVYTPMKVSLKETIESLIDKKFAKL